MNLLIVVPDGVGIKNYLYSDFLEKLLEAPDFNVSIVTRLNIDFIRELFDGIPLKLYQCPAYKESTREQILREAIKFARLKYSAQQLNNPSILNSRSQASTKSRKMLLKLTELLGSILCASGYKSILAAENQYYSLLAKKDLSAFESLFNEIKPDVIISTHQRPVENIPLYELARRMGIKRTSVIYSWDNVARATINSRSETYYAWSRFMVNQMKLFYPEIPERNIRITGTPQFSFYLNPAYHRTREEFCKAFEIPPEKKVVVFSGSDLKTSPYDPELLSDVFAVIDAMPEAEKPVLIFRRSPADFTNRYDAVLTQHKEIISIDPLWINKGNSWITAIPTRADIKNIVGLMQHSALIINVASTMALDGAIFDKPAMYLAYTPANAPHFDYKKEIHGEDHFKVLHDIDGVGYIYDKKELAPFIHSVLAHPEQYCKDRKIFLERITDNIIMEAGENLVNELRSQVKQPTAIL